jgi:hypothetical protein
MLICLLLVYARVYATTAELRIDKFQTGGVHRTFVVMWAIQYLKYGYCDWETEF